MTWNAPNLPIFSSHSIVWFCALVRAVQFVKCYHLFSSEYAHITNTLISLNLYLCISNTSCKSQVVAPWVNLKIEYRHCIESDCLNVHTC